MWVTHFLDLSVAHKMQYLAGPFEWFRWARTRDLPTLFASRSDAPRARPLIANFSFPRRADSHYICNQQ